MVRLSLLYTSVATAFLASVSVFAQDTCDASCVSAATGLQACGTSDEQCICSTDMVAAVSACVSCVEGAGISLADTPELGLLAGHADLCRGLGIEVEVPTPSETPASPTTNSTPLASEQTKEASNPGNSAVGLPLSLGALTAAAAFSLNLLL